MFKLCPLFIDPPHRNGEDTLSLHQIPMYVRLGNATARCLLVDLIKQGIEIEIGGLLESRDGRAEGVSEPEETL